MSLKKPESPCLKCDDRSAECHAACVRYEVYVKLKDEYKAALLARREAYEHVKYPHHRMKHRGMR